MKKNIAVMAGGYSSEREVSLWTAENIMNALDKKYYNPYLILVDADRWYLQAAHKEYEIDKNDFSVQLSDARLTFDYAFIAIHGTPAEDGLLQGYFKLLNIPHSASEVMPSALSFNKFAYNHFIKSFDIVKVANSVLVLENEPFNAAEILAVTGLPCFVKPNQQGSSFGISKVDSEEDLTAAIAKAFQQDDAVIIEEFLAGTEVTNGCIKLNGKVRALHITEVVSKNALFDFQAKYDPAFADEITPARISEELTKRIQGITERIYKVSGFKGIVRIDYIIKGSEIYMLEANTIPGMTSNSFIPKQLASEGKTMTEVLSQLIG